MPKERRVLIVGMPGSKAQWIPWMSSSIEFPRFKKKFSLRKSVMWNTSWVGHFICIPWSGINPKPLPQGSHVGWKYNEKQTL
jgi:hypothetical protein